MTTKELEKFLKKAKGWVPEDVLFSEEVGGDLAMINEVRATNFNLQMKRAENGVVLYFLE